MVFDQQGDLALLKDGEGQQRAVDVLVPILDRLDRGEDVVLDLDFEDVGDGAPVVAVGEAPHAIADAVLPVGVVAESHVHGLCLFLGL